MVYITIGAKSFIGEKIDFDLVILKPVFLRSLVYWCGVLVNIKCPVFLKVLFV